MRLELKEIFELAKKAEFDFSECSIGMIMKHIERSFTKEDVEHLRQISPQTMADLCSDFITLGGVLLANQLEKGAAEKSKGVQDERTKES